MPLDSPSLPAISLVATPYSLFLTRSMRFGAHEHWAAALGARVLGEHSQPARHLLIGLEHAAQVAAEPVLVELVGGGRVPQPAAVRADLVGQHDAHLLVLPQPAELDLEVDEADAD